MHPPWAAFAILVLGVMMAASAAHAWHLFTAEELEDRFFQQAQDVTQPIAAELARYEDMLHALAQLRGSLDDRSITQTVVALDIYRRFPGIASIRYVPSNRASSGTADQIEAFQASRATGMSAIIAPQGSTEALAGRGAPFSVVDPVSLGRRAGFAGWVVMEIDPEAFLDGIFSYRALAVDVAFTDTVTGAGSGRTRMWATTGDQHRSDLSPLPPHEVDTRAFERQWHITIWPSPGFRSAGDTLHPLEAFGLLLIPPFLLFFLVWALTHSRSRALKAVDHATSALRTREVELAHQATHDSLTGLPNRRLLADHLELSLARSRRSHTALALLFIDLDHFKSINDGLGHKAGDAALVEVASRMKAAVRPSDTVARLGGDEFVVLCDDIGSADEAMLVAERITRLVSEPMMIDDGVITVRSSIGVAVHHGNQMMDAEEMLQRADGAMYEVKEHGRDGSYLVTDGMKSAATAIS